MPPKGSRGAKQGSSSGSASSRAAALLAKARAASSSSPRASAAVKRDPATRGESAALPGFSATSDAFPSSSVPNSYLSSSSASSGASVNGSSSSGPQLPLPVLLKRLTSGSGRFSVREAIPVAGKLLKAKLASEEALSLLSNHILEERAGIESQEERAKIITAFGAQTAAASRKRRRADHFESDEYLSREWGNVSAPSASSSKKLLASSVPLLDYHLNPILSLPDLRGRYCYVNRAPVLTAWCVVLLERLGFGRREALSVAHCYVSRTATARGVAIGVFPASKAQVESTHVGSGQPHFELMGVKVPVMQVDVPRPPGMVESEEEGKEWRGIDSEGNCVGPERAFNYIRKSMAQTLPLVVGALSLLADSWMQDEGGGVGGEEGVKEEGGEVKQELDANSDQVGVEHEEHATSVGSEPTDAATFLALCGPDVLHSRAYQLYTLFRPSTGGQWGKRARFELDKVLALRRGHQDEWEREWAHRVDEEDEDVKGGRDVKAPAKTDEEQAQEATVDEERALQEDIERAIQEEEAAAAEQSGDSKRVKVEEEQ